jgi:hypothetical protein
MTKQELKRDAEVKAAKVRALAQDGLNSTEIAKAVNCSCRTVGAESSTGARLPASCYPVCDPMFVRC